MNSLFNDKPASVEFCDLPIIRGSLAIHAPNCSKIVDITFGNGSIYGGQKPIEVEEYCGDFFNLPFEAHSFDCVIFDPPHIPDTNNGDAGRCVDWRHRYGLTKDQKWNDACWWRGALPGIFRILRNGGICLLKVCDYVNGHRFHSPLADIFALARENGGLVCDIAIKARKMSVPESSRWDNQFHFRRKHSYWIILRKGKKCEPSRAAARAEREKHEQTS